MSYAAQLLAYAVGLFGGMLLFMETGRRLGARRAARDPEAAKSAVGTIDGAVFALLGLLVAFSFSGAAARFDARRQLIVEEANDIGTAYLRLDLLPPAAQPELRAAFRQYVDSRLAAYNKLPDLAAVERELEENARLQRLIWQKSVEACVTQNSPAATTLLMSALNEMIDITTTRTMAGRLHPPRIIFFLLVGMALASAMLAGYEMGNSSRRRSPLHMLAFAGVTSLAFYVILDLEYPRLGFIQVAAFDRALVDVRSSMHE
jgi:hypothetical protein